MLKEIKQYDVKRKSVINEKTVAKMWAYTDYEEVLNLIVKVDQEEYCGYTDEVKDQIKEDIRYFVWLSFKEVVDNNIHIERLHSEMPEFIDIDIRTSVGVNEPHYPAETSEVIDAKDVDVVDGVNDGNGFGGLGDMFCSMMGNMMMEQDIQQNVVDTVEATDTGIDMIADTVEG